MYHKFFIQSSVDGHLDCFHVLAMVNSAEMNSGIHVYFLTLVLSVVMPRSGVAGSYSVVHWSREWIKKLWFIYTIEYYSTKKGTHLSQF